MKKLLITIWLVALSAGPVFSQQKQVLPPRRNALPPPIEDMVEGFYVSQLPVQVELSDEQFTKVLPLLRQTLRERREITARRTRAMAQLRLMVQRGDSEEEMKRLIREIDKADAEIQASQEKFLSGVDPLLTTSQQARLRFFQLMIEQRIRRMIDRARVPGANRQPPPDFPGNF